MQQIEEAGNLIQNLDAGTITLFLGGSFTLFGNPCMFGSQANSPVP